MTATLHMADRTPEHGAAKLRIALISGLIAPRYGGPSSVIKMHADALAEHHSVSIYGVGSEDESCGGSGTHMYPLSFPKRWYRGRGLHRALAAKADAADVFHAHMLWDHPVWAAARAARKRNVPLFVSPHGSVMDDRADNLHKRLYGATLLKQVLKHTAGVHVLNNAEADACRRHGIRNPLFVIPNGLPDSSFDLTTPTEQIFSRWPNLRGRRILLFVGRLAHIKGLDMLLKAFAPEADGAGRDWTIVLAGPDQDDHRAELELAVKELGIRRRVFFTGPVYGIDKEALLSSAHACVLPSKSEGFSMALLEGAAKAKPVLYTTTCHFPELAQAQGGIEVKPDVNSIQRGLHTLLTSSEAALRNMGRAARELALRSYTMNQVAAQLETMYREAA